MGNKQQESEGSKPAKAAKAAKSVPEFSRWALFEAQVLAKVKFPEKCKKVIAKRQSQVDDDSTEAELVAACIRLKIRQKGQNPEVCCLFWTTAEITVWL